ncbi:glycoside hydrolase family 2 TIM barrel-domain containing protein [Demequina sp. NBRC 110054]|uniref:glycoside hydrolase family 2 TIM barrel-domain containing protein n=1 Tax=Demequina sp. NBRC 110054 TaxID=1570343 RepID=UPI0009FFEF3A|nr:glycoside hydrolase family 2 TIM barrel-domain containing protein [Demequina sp. NBRC 110054]
MSVHSEHGAGERVAPRHLDVTRMRADVDDPRVVGYGRLTQRAERRKEDTCERVSLRGTWDFRWSPTWAEADVDDALFGSARRDDAALAGAGDGWDRIEVPGVWELAGYGTPYYLAFRFPPAIRARGRRLGTIDPQDTPTGIYRRAVRVPSEWGGRRVTLRFEGVKSAFHLFVDGRLFGYSEGSMTGATFDLTDVAVPGGELAVVVVVHRYSTGTFLEDQDMWFLSGITRDVWLEAEPAHAPWDVAVTTDLDPASGLGSIAIETLGGDGECVVELDGAEIARAVIATGTSSDDGGLTLAATTLAATGLEVAPWSAERPHLHDLTVTTTSADGEVDVRRLRVGFRRVEIVGEELRVNGRAVVLHGVNRHDFHPTRIWDVPDEVRERDIVLMKRANVNALRLSHYPNPDQVYRLCDEHGLYVMDEAEVESHGVRRRGIPGDGPEWRPSVVARVEAMVRRSRSHPSVIMWSLGNEAGDGEAFHEAKRAVLALDASRPVHYEGDTTLETSDVMSLMYPDPQLEETIGEGRDITVGPLERVMNALAADTKGFTAAQYAGRPVIACEYLHAMENSFGNAAAHVENFHRYDRWAGGFVWDWVDQTIEVPLHDGRTRRAYGGAFGERPTDRWFCANGIVAADRTPHPAYTELAKVYQHVVIARTPDGVRVTNRHAFDDLSGLVLRWRVERDGVAVAKGHADDATVAPAEARTFAIPASPVDGPGLWTLTAALHLREGSTWAESGHVVAWEQFTLARTVVTAATDRSWSVRRSGSRAALVRGDDRVVVDLRSGAIDSLVLGGSEHLATPLALNLWRAPTDNDRGLANFAPVLDLVSEEARWRRAVGRARVRSVVGSNAVSLAWRVRGADVRLTLTGAEGGVRLSLEAVSRRPLMRLGLTATLDEGLRRVHWLGRGPGENHRDRRTGSALGAWQASVGEMPHAYPHPQENGNRADLERLELRGDRGGLRLTRLDGEPFEASVRPYTQAELAAARYADQLPDDGPATLCLDVAQCGVGGDKPGEARLQPEGVLEPGRRWRTEWLIESAEAIADAALTADAAPTERSEG